MTNDEWPMTKEIRNLNDEGGTRGRAGTRSTFVLRPSSFGFCHCPELPHLGRYKVMNDLKFALRQLLKNPGFTAVAVLTLALGIGANTAIFSTVNGVLLKPLPYSEPGQLVMVFEDESGDGRGLTAVAGGVFIDWKEQATCFDALSVISGTDMNLTGGELPERLSGSQVSASFLNILRVKPIIGRGF